MNDYLPGVTAVLTAHTPRLQDGMLDRALASVWGQHRPVEAVSVAVDHHHEGAGPTRTRALAAVQTEWTAFLDSDDEWYPQHIKHLMRHAEITGADLVYPWFDCLRSDGTIGTMWPEREGREWDPENPYLFPISALVRTSYAQQCEFPSILRSVLGPHGEPENPNWQGDDWPFWCQVFELGAKVVHLNERTWVYHHWGVSRPGYPKGNTSGRGDRW